ncbi:MAG: universal stress protein, partial [Kiritimatiellales bacterium]
MKKILVAVDFSKCTERLIEQAGQLAKALDARTWVVHVTSDRLPAVAQTYWLDFSQDPLINLPLDDIEMSRDLCAKEYNREHQALLHLSEKLRRDGVPAQAMLLKGHAAECLLEQAENFGADMIIMGSHGHGMLRKMLTGSVTEAVLRE